MKYINYLVTLLLLLTLVYLRVSIRSTSPLWVDEVEEINHLKSVKHLILEYLPNIPGALPGHYLIALPMNHISPGNKYILGLPGLSAHILVFLLIPYTISLLHVVDKKNLQLVSLATRVGFVFDPRLTFQSMEIRPYSILPLLWIISVIICSNLIKLNSKSGTDFIKHFVFSSFFTLLILLWHFYGVIMVTTCYLYFLSKKNGIKKLKISHLISSYPIIISLIIALPIWKFFTRGLAQYKHNTFEFLTLFTSLTMSPYLINQIITAIVMVFTLVLFLLFFFKKYDHFDIKKLFLDKLVYWHLKNILFFLIIIPILIIFFLDLIQPYRFLYRQFAWTAVPFYMALGLILSTISRNIKNLYKKNDL